MACQACERDEKALHTWRSVGGVIPPQSCRKRHGVRCRDCGKRLTRNPGKRCDKCFNEWWRVNHGFDKK